MTWQHHASRDEPAAVGREFEVSVVPGSLSCCSPERGTLDRWFTAVALRRRLQPSCGSIADRHLTLQSDKPGERPGFFCLSTSQGPSSGRVDRGTSAQGVSCSLEDGGISHAPAGAAARDSDSAVEAAASGRVDRAFGRTQHEPAACTGVVVHLAQRATQTDPEPGHHCLRINHSWRWTADARVGPDQDRLGVDHLQQRGGNLAASGGVLRARPEPPTRGSIQLTCSAWNCLQAAQQWRWAPALVAMRRQQSQRQ